ncbi:17198_t:CDS:2 [Dentiscutata heterogama]|uniref:17198_t:CDS:1 n=1 Tax=Dentiscutata heterogama TaxID=1316150 RepID=A0ACA9MN98_9GLOM|nr:17198_t:CDS:2 [Dentiscutata heterogama]
MDNDVQNLLKLLNKFHYTLACCESMTGGKFASILTKSPGAGRIFKGGFIVYTNEAKKKLAKISPYILNNFTGNAGPTAQENKSVGQIYIGISSDYSSFSKDYHFNGSRSEIVQQAIKTGIQLLINAVKKFSDDKLIDNNHLLSRISKREHNN